MQSSLRSALDQIPQAQPIAQGLRAEFLADEAGIELQGAPINTRDFLIDPGTDGGRAGFFLDPIRPTSDQTSNSPQVVADLLFNEGADVPALIAAGTIYTQSDEGLTVYRDLGAQDVALDDLRVGLGLAAQISAADVQAISAVSSGAQGTLQGAGPSGSFIQSAVLLFIGGLLLNVMPCVFPILFLKLKTALSGQSDLRASFAWTSAGMIGTFAVLGGVLALIQAATGAQLTLGAWMQFPLTTLVLAALLVLFIANALGWFEFVLPASIAGAGQGRSGAFGDVLAGMVAALMGGACAGLCWPLPWPLPSQQGG